MRNPNRTTKRERAAARRSCPTICRMIGVNAAARLRRQGLSDDATAFDRMLLALDLPPEVMGDGTGSHWSDYRNLAKTEDGRVVYIDPDEYARTSRQIMDELTPHLDGMLDAELTAAGLDPADYRVGFVEEYPLRELQPRLEMLPEATTVTGLDGRHYAVSYGMPEVEPVTEVRADSPDVPEAFRVAVEAFVAGQNGDPADYTVAYRASELEGDRAEFLILPKWADGGIVEEYRRLYGDRIDLAAAPVGAPPFNTELFETYRRAFDDTAQLTVLDDDGNPTGPTHQITGPTAITVEHLEENQTKWAEVAAAVMRGMGELRVPRSLTIDLDPDAQTELRTAITEACDGEPGPVPTIVTDEDANPDV